jgi:hypothetical protein
MASVRLDRLASPAPFLVETTSHTIHRKFGVISVILSFVARVRVLRGFACGTTYEVSDPFLTRS